MRLIFVLALFLSEVFIVTAASAGSVNTDGSLGPVSTLSGPNYAIGSNLGRIKGNNLFHSFSQFDLSQGDIATFSGPSTITNIISRVISNNPSSINGTIRSSINGANLYLLNPSGIIFGPKATLDVTGSFHASTADYLQFGQERFSTNPQLPLTITVQDPTAFGFLKSNPAAITVNGSLMAVPQGKNISLVAGDINSTNANLWAYGGTINLVSIASSGEVIYDGIRMTPQGFTSLGSISITENRPARQQPAYSTSVLPGTPTSMRGASIANLDASGQGGGNIFIRGGSFYMTGGRLYNDTYGKTAPGSIDVNVTRDVTIAGTNITGNSMFGQNNSGASIAVTGTNISATNGTVINTDSFTLANGSPISLKATNTIILDGVGTTVSSDAISGGKAGDLLLEAPSIVIGTGARVSSSAPILNGGPSTGAGAITVNADRTLTLSGSIRSNTASGAAGAITIRTQDMNITGTGLISSSLLTNPTTTPRSSGDITITANNLNMSGDGRIESRAFYSNSGSSGTISINAANVTLTDRSAISASIDSVSGTGGHINITASGDILVSSNPINLLKELGSIASDSTAGDAGHVRLEANNITINNGATLSTVAQGGTGEGGDITLIAHNNLIVKGSGSEGSAINPSSIQTDTLAGGTAGTIVLTSPQVQVTNGALVSSASLPGSTGAAGNITVTADTLTVDAGHFSSDSAAGNAGHITIGVKDAAISHGGTLSTVAQGGAGNGGNINVNATGSLKLEGVGQGVPASAQSSIQTDTLASGAAGTIALTSPQVQVTNGALVSSASLPGSTGAAGNITVTADTLNVDAGHFSSDSAAGNAGHITIGVKDAAISHGGTLSTVAQGGAGNGGNINVNATASLKLEGVGPGVPASAQSSIQTDTLASGAAGTIALTSPQVQVTNGALVSSASLPGSTGAAGNITVTADTLNVDAGHFSSDSAAGNAGHITIGVKDAAISHGGTLSTVAQGGAGNGGNINVNATASLKLEGVGPGVPASAQSSIQTDTLASGAAGTIALTSPQVQVTNGALVSSASLPGSTGAAGNITVTADTLNVDAGHFSSDSAAGNAGHITIGVKDAAISHGGTLSTVAQGGAGNGGNINVNATASLKLEGVGPGVPASAQSSIQTDTLASGAAGTIALTSPQVQVTNGALVSSASLPGSTGAAGNITVTADTLNVDAGHFSSDSAAGNAGHITIGVKDAAISHGGTLSTVAQGGAGNGGNINVNATGSLKLEGVGPGVPASAQSSIQTDTLASGAAGTIALTSPQVQVTNGALVSSASLPGSTGAAGNITVTADTLNVDAGHFSSDSAAGNAGHITIGVKDAAISHGGTLSTVAQGGAGNGGNINVNATGSLKLEGVGPGVPASAQSSIQTDTLASGAAGTIALTSPQVQVTNGALVSSASLPGSTGAAGNITVTADTLTVDAASITTQSVQSQGGNIYITASDIMNVTHGDITASATGGYDNGGNVTIDAGDLRLKKGQITAQAEWGNGGNLLITVAKFFIKSADSLVSASSRYGQQGTAVINAPNTDVAGALTAPVFDILNLNSFIPKRCMAPNELNASTFRLLGSTGLPASPENSFPITIPQSSL